MADFLISSALDFLKSSAIEEIKLLWNVKDEVDSLSNTLSTIRDVLEDAEEQQISSRAVKNWLRQLKDVAYDADDVLDDFATQAAQAMKMEVPLESSSRLKKVKTSLTSYNFVNKFTSKHEMGSKMKEICARLDKIERDIHRFHFNTSFPGRTVEKIDRPQTSSFVDESTIYGRDDDKKKIIEIMKSVESNNGNNFSVLPIIGMGGQGKTTLAQLVYNDKQLQNLFEVRAWVCVSDNFDVLKITHEIIESLTSHSESFTILDSAQRRLSELLSGKRFLIILDDVWNEDPFSWERLSHPFFGGARGSKIIVTTRLEKVAKIMGTIPPHSIKCLSQDDSWSLFERKVFGDNNLDIVQGTLIDIGKKIVGKCCGLPLAIKSMGGMLSTTRNLNIWKNVLESKIWELQDRNNGILPALRLSYHHLSSNLKQCFSYCSIFPKDYQFNKEELVLLWIGEGYIQSKAGMEMEEVGEELFDDLLARSFFSLLSRGDTTVYNMHDLNHDLAEFVSKEDCLRIETDELIKKPLYIARHLSIIREKLVKLDGFYGCKNLLRIRTLILQTLLIRSGISIQLGDSFDKFSCLRVLSLTHGDIKEIPHSIGNLKHLRYLDLSWNVFERLPDSICSLYTLQTLILDSCFRLIELPKGTMELINLRHLLLDAYRLTCWPPKMGKLTQLRSLRDFIVRGDGSECTIVELKHLVNLRGNFEISSLENLANREEAEDADLKNKKHLERLTLEWGVRDPWNAGVKKIDQAGRKRFDNIGQEEVVLEGLQPHINLKRLEISHYMGASLPSWLLEQNQLLTFTNLESITFLKCWECQLLPPLGKLPSLKYLKVQGVKGVEQLEHQFSGVRGFPLLEFLYLKDLSNLKEAWGEEGGGDYMPSLHTLKVIKCPKLKRFPLHLSPALSELKIKDCAELVAELRFPSLEKLTLSGSNSSLVMSVPYLTSLQVLTIAEDKVESLDMQNLRSLQDLRFYDCSQLSSFYPPVNLRSLHIHDCLNLEALPLELHNLSSLNELTLLVCINLASLPDNGLPASLNHLEIDLCPLLYKRCKAEEGEDWDKISHIPVRRITMDEGGLGGVYGIYYFGR